MPDKTILAKPLVRSEASILSPLRYPGAKRRLSGYIAEVLRVNDLRPKIFTEPFAGGASVALQLLQDNLVDTIALGEVDPLIASFWKIVFNEPEWLIDQIENIPVTLEMWSYYKEGRFRTNRDRALACLFLNRTSFSGILAQTAGPLGGYKQESPYPIDCRFPVSTIRKRILQAAALRERVLFVRRGDWSETIAKIEDFGYATGEVFYYLDPPFYSKADKLYRFFFDDAGHDALHQALVKIEQPWLLSYDTADQILKLYSHNGAGPKRIDHLYSIAASDRLQNVEELIITNLPNLPEETRLWRSSEEWGRGQTS